MIARCFQVGLPHPNETNKTNTVQVQTYRFNIMGNHVAVSDSIINPFAKNRTTTRHDKTLENFEGIGVFLPCGCDGKQKLFCQLFAKNGQQFAKIRDFPESTQQETVQKLKPRKSDAGSSGIIMTYRDKAAFS